MSLRNLSLARIARCQSVALILCLVLVLEDSPKDAFFVMCISYIFVTCKISVFERISNIFVWYKKLQDSSRR